MLPSHSSAGELLNVAPDQTKHIDNDCDTNDDDDDDDSDDSSRIRRSTPAHVRLNVNGAHRLVAIEPTDMTVTPKIDNLIVRRPSALQLKPINTTNLLCSEECALNLSFDDDKVETSEVDGRTRNDTQKRITIGFENVKYSSRGRHFWERGKCGEYHKSSFTRANSFCEIENQFLANRVGVKWIEHLMTTMSVNQTFTTYSHINPNWYSS